MASVNRLRLAAAGFVMALLAACQPAPSPTPYVIHTDQWTCTTVYLNGTWQWPPICSPVKP